MNLHLSDSGIAGVSAKADRISAWLRDAPPETTKQLLACACDLASDTSRLQRVAMNAPEVVQALIDMAIVKIAETLDDKNAPHEESPCPH